MKDNNLKEFGLKLKQELQNDQSIEMAKKITNEIKTAKYQNGTPLSVNEKNDVINYIKFPNYDPLDRHITLHESDNEEFLKLVALITKSVSE